MARGTPEDVAKFRTARQITREVKQVWEPKSLQGKQTKTGQILQKVVDEEATPESVIDALFGRGGPTTSGASGAPAALNRIKQGLDQLADREVGQRTWNDIRLTYWSKLVLDARGNQLSEKLIANNLDAAFKNQGTMLKILFIDGELKQFRAFSRALKDASFKDSTPSGTPQGLRALLRNDTRLAQVAKRFFRVKQASETFAKKRFWMARLYQNISTHFPADPIGLRNELRTKVARDLVRDFGKQDIPAQSFGPIGGAIGAQLGQSELEQTP